MSFLIWIVFGGLAGWVASLIMGIDGQQGIVLNVIVGVIGAGIGGFLMQTFGQAGVSGFSLYSFMVAVIGAIVLLGLLRLVRG